MRANARDLRENTGLMRVLSAERRIFEKCRRYCRAWKILGGPAGCLARALLVKSSLRVYRVIREIYPRISLIYADLRVE